MNEKNKERIVSVRVSEPFFHEFLKDVDNKSQYIRNAIESYIGLEFREQLLDSYLQIIRLFKDITEHFEDRKTLTLEELGELIKKYITDEEKIDEINQIIGVN